MHRTAPRRRGVEFIAPPDTTLKAKAPLTTASLETLLYKADQGLAAMREGFLDTAAAGLKRLYAAFAGLKPNTPAPEAAHALFVAAHDLRGQAGTFGFVLVTEIADSLCRLVEDRETFSSMDLDGVRVHLDAIALALGRRIKGTAEPEALAILDGLAKVRAKLAD